MNCENSDLSWELFDLNYSLIRIFRAEEPCGDHRRIRTRSSRSKQSTYRVLLALAAGEWLQGYAIMQAVSQMTHAREAILRGTLYAALARMADDGLVEAREGSVEDLSGGPKRRYYQLTSLGRGVARAESERLRALLDLAVAQRILPGGKK